MFAAPQSFHAKWSPSACVGWLRGKCTRTFDPFLCQNLNYEIIEYHSNPNSQGTAYSFVQTSKKRLWSDSFFMWHTFMSCGMNYTITLLTLIAERSYCCWLLFSDLNRFSSLCIVFIDILDEKSIKYKPFHYVCMFTMKYFRNTAFLCSVSQFS